MQSLKREFIILYREPQAVLFPLGFFLLSLLLMGFTFEQTQLSDPVLLDSLFWIILILCSLLATDRLFCDDYHAGVIETVLCSQHSLLSFVIAKMVVQWLAILCPLVLMIAVIGVLNQHPGNIIIDEMIGFGLGTPVIAMLSTWVACLTCGLPRGGFLVALIVMPFYIPVIIFASRMLMLAQAGRPIEGPIWLLSGLLIVLMAVVPWCTRASLYWQGE